MAAAVETIDTQVETVSSVTNAKKNEKKKWKWEEEMIQSLVDALKDYKSICEFNSLDFSADKVKLYEDVRKTMAVSYPESFGPVKVSTPAKPVKEMSKKEYDAYNQKYNSEMNEIKMGYKRVKEKIKSIRQDYSKAVTSGRRSGSGKVVLEFYEDLTTLWGGSPSTQPLSFGVDSLGINDVAGEQDLGDKDVNGITVLQTLCADCLNILLAT